MHPRDRTTRDRLGTVLARRAPASATELAEAAGVSIPSVHRMLQELEGRVVSAGKARRARYALRRPLRGQGAPLPLYEVDATGRAERVGALSLIEPQGSCLDLAASGWPVLDESRDGWWPGLPYPLYDMRPQGYLGRQFARAEHRQLAVSANPDEWGDDEVAYVLSRSGAHASGSLILGDPAFERWQNLKLAPPEPLAANHVAAAYARLAEQAIAEGVAGSSAAGEFPKFPAQRELPGCATPHVLVKFSGADDSPAVRRWADLLVCEHLALQCAAALPGIESAPSRIVGHAGRTFLEVERFDRHGEFGRSRLGSLTTLNAALIGEGSTDWTRLAARFAAAGLLDAEAVARVEHLWWFGRLIANTDMHTGNLSLRLQGGPAIAPAYDMLPMLYAPLPGGEVAARSFEPPLPLPPQRAVWGAACVAAIDFWDEAGRDGRVSAGFRAICRANAEVLRQVAGRV